ncbi:MAG: hypothetical protein ACFFDD_14540 [Promethearchaeota archaeon]
MTRTNLVFLGILFLSLMFIRAAPVAAHGPSAVHLDYDFETQVLTVDVSHNVANPNTHYIIQIVIEKNSAHFMTRDYTSQPSTTNIVDTFDVPAVDGDLLTVTAYCNSVGSFTESITVTDSSATTTTEPTTTTSTTTTQDGTPTNPTTPAGMDITLVLVAGAAGVVIIIVAFAFTKRG